MVLGCSRSSPTHGLISKFLCLTIAKESMKVRNPCTSVMFSPSRTVTNVLLLLLFLFLSHQRWKINDLDYLHSARTYCITYSFKAGTVFYRLLHLSPSKVACWLICSVTILVNYLANTSKRNTKYNPHIMHSTA